MEVPTHSSRVAELDSLRALAALAVVFHHLFKLFRGELAALLPPWAFSLADFIQAQNHRAVMAFFVLSGFTIALATRGRPPISGPMLRDYLYRRATRIVPLYYFSLAWTAVFGVAYGLGHPDFSLSTLAGNALFLQTSASAKGNWFAPYGLNGPYWSLSYEVFYYLALPIVLWMSSQRRGGGSPSPAMLVSLGVIAMFGGLAANLAAPSPFSAFATLWIVWLVGYAACGSTPGAKVLVLVALPAALTIATSAVLAAGGQSSDTLASMLDGTLIAFAFAVPAIWRGWSRNATVRLFRQGLNAAFERIGRGSYALYLLHYPMLLAFDASLADMGLGLSGWIAAGLLFAGFIVLFCPWIERVSLLLFRGRSRLGKVPAGADAGPVASAAE